MPSVSWQSGPAGSSERWFLSGSSHPILPLLWVRSGRGDSPNRRTWRVRLLLQGRCGRRIVDRARTNYLSLTAIQGIHGEVKRMAKFKLVMKCLLALLFLSAGVLHFVRPEQF